MSITRLQQARQMYAMGQRVAKTLDGSRPGYAGPAGGASALGNYGGDSSGGTSANEMSGAGPSNDNPDNSPHIHTGPTYSPPTTVLEDEVALTGFGTVPGVDYSAVSPESQFALNTQLQNELSDATYQPPNFPSFIPGSTLIKTLGSFGFNTNKDFFEKNVAGKYGFGYGIDAYKDYMEKRMAGEVGAYGNVEQGQNAINASSGGDEGIMDVYNNLGADTGTGTGDADGDGDVDQTDDFIFRYFDKTGETLQAGAGGVEDLMTRIRQRINDIFTT